LEIKKLLDKPANNPSSVPTAPIPVIADANPLPNQINDETIAAFLSRVPKQKGPEKQALLDSLTEALKATPPKSCYYNCNFNQFKSKSHYERHVLHHHPGKLCYPNLPYFKTMNLKPQGCLWEK